MHTATTISRMDELFVEVPGKALADLCDLVDQAVDELERTKVNPALATSLRGSVAEVKCHTHAAPAFT